MLIIKKLLWDKWNTVHITRHAIIPEEVEEVCKEEPIVQQGTIKNRLVLLGLTTSQRLLNVVLEPNGKGAY